MSLAKLATVLHFGDLRLPMCETVKIITSKSLAGADVTITIPWFLQIKTSNHNVNLALKKEELVLFFQREVNVTIRGFDL